MNFESAFENASEITFDKFSFEEPTYEMLIVNDETEYLEHLKVQGAGMAYFTALAKASSRQLDKHEQAYKFRYNEMYAECSDLLLRSGKKNNVRDVEAFVQMKYSEEINKYNTTINKLRSQKDYIEAFLEGWKQKSYILSSMTQMITAGLLTPKETITENDTYNRKENLNMARNILKRKNESN